MQHRPHLTATVANGERVSCLGVIRQAALTISGDTFATNLFVMPLAGYDVVLGTQWLASLGPILWDFHARKMTFKRNARDICWHGVAGLHATTASATLLDELLDSFSDVFAEPHRLPPVRLCLHDLFLAQSSTLL